MKVALNTISQTKSIYHLEYNAPHHNNMDICSNHKIQNQYANKEMNILDTFINRILHNRRIFPYLKMNLIGCICIHAWIQPFNEINRHVIIKYILHIPRPWRSRSISIILMEEMMDEKKISVLDTRFHRPRLHKPSLIVHLKESHIEIFSSRID